AVGEQPGGVGEREPGRGIGVELKKRRSGHGGDQVAVCQAETPCFTVQGGAGLVGAAQRGGGGVAGGGQPHPGVTHAGVGGGGAAERFTCGGEVFRAAEQAERLDAVVEVVACGHGRLPSEPEDLVGVGGGRVVGNSRGGSVGA